MQARIALSQLIGQAAGAVRRGVVDDENRGLGQSIVDGRDDGGQVLYLIVGGDDDE